MTDFTIQSFADAIGVSKPTIWKYISDGSIHAYRLGKTVRIPFDQLDRLRTDNRIGGAL
jgi:excisionase family DNA binding protein